MIRLHRCSEEPSASRQSCTHASILEQTAIEVPGTQCATGRLSSRYRLPIDRAKECGGCCTVRTRPCSVVSCGTEHAAQNMRHKTCGTKHAAQNMRNKTCGTKHVIWSRASPQTQAGNGRSSPPHTGLPKQRHGGRMAMSVRVRGGRVRPPQSRIEVHTGAGRDRS